MSPLTHSLVLAAGLVASATQAAAVDFSLYAYGIGFEGYRVVYKDTGAYIFSGNLSTSTEFTPVTFTPGSDTGLTTWTANPDNTTRSPIVGNATWFNQLFYIPSTSGEQVGFASQASDDQQTSIFRLFGATAMTYINEQFQTAFTVVAAGDNVWQLKWNDTSGSPITLRTSKPGAGGDKSKVRRAYNIIA